MSIRANPRLIFLLLFVFFVTLWFLFTRGRFPSLALRASIRATKKPLAASFETARGFENFPGDTYFRVCCTIIGSESLTTVFGMGTGVSFPISSPGSTRAGRLKPARANLLLGSDGCVPFVLACFQSPIRCSAFSPVNRGNTNSTGTVFSH